jgi:RND superfamily putative drug exporter
LAGFARWCLHHRRAVLAVWLIALIGFFAAGRLAGSAYTNTFSLPGTDSTQALNVLKADFPARAGDSEQIVVQARQGTLRSAAAESAVTSMLGRVARLPHVQSVVSPYTPGGLISMDGTIGLATVNLDAQAQDIPTAAVTALVSTARSADSSLLNVQLGGAAVQNSQSSGETRACCSGSCSR